jgi:Spy/CpxP family protein refolding chaperone
MKFSLFLVVLFAVFCSINIFAQRGMSVEERMKELDKQLDLSDKQYSQVEKIMENQSKKFRNLWQESNGNRESMREEGRKLRKETDDKIMKVLNDEQKKKYKKLMEERRKNRSGKRLPN